MYSSRSSFKFPVLFQIQPKIGDDDHRSWTESLSSYKAAARHHAGLLKLNQRIKPRSNYRWAMTVSLEEELPANEVNKIRSAVFRELREKCGMVAAWTAEVTRDNRVHFHLVINAVNLESLSSILQTSERKHKVKLWFQRIKKGTSNSYLRATCNYIDYICKAKQGHMPVLFVPNSGITKTGTIGSFWRKPVKFLRDYQIQKYHHRPKKGMQQLGAVELVNHLDSWFGGSVDRRFLCQRVGTLSTCHWWSEFGEYDRIRRWRLSLL